MVPKPEKLEPASIQASLGFANEADIAHHEFRAGADAVLYFKMPVIRKILNAPMIVLTFDAPSARQQLIPAPGQPKISQTRPAF